MSEKVPELRSEGQMVRESHGKEVREEWVGEGGRSSISKFPQSGKGQKKVQGTKWRPKWRDLKNCRTDNVEER